MFKKSKFKTEPRKKLEIESSIIKDKKISFSEEIVNISNKLCGGPFFTGFSLLDDWESGFGPGAIQNPQKDQSRFGEYPIPKDF